MLKIDLTGNRVIFLLLSAFIALSNSSNPPDGRTGAPFDGLCSDCHGGGSFDGDISLTGLPTDIMPNTTYNLSLTITATSGSPMVGGIQIVGVNQSNQNSGDLINTSAETGTSFSSGREYLDQRGAKSFTGNTVSWNFDWKSPNGPNGSIHRLYFAGNLANGNGSSSGDKIVNDFFTTTMVGGGNPLSVMITNKTNVSCFGQMDGTATALAAGGNPPYDYNWSNGGTTNQVTGLGPGLYTITVTDNAFSSATNTVLITEPTLLKAAVQILSHVTCPKGRNGSVSVFPSGGTPPYSIIYSTGSPNNLSAGLYTVTVTDSKNCITEVEFEITEPEAYTVELLNLIHPKCPNDSTGKIFILVSGASPPYKYKWNTGEITDSLVAKPTGTYTITITDSKNCGTTSSFVLNSVDTIPPVLVGRASNIYLDQHGNFLLNPIDYIDQLSDQCDPNPVLSIAPDSVSCANLGRQDFILSATDKYGNSSTETLQLEILDTLNPIISAWTDTSFNVCNIVVPKFSASDNCALLSFTQTEGPSEGEVFLPGLNTMSFEAVDSSGNKTTTTFQVEIKQALSIWLDTVLYEKCYGDSVWAQISFSHQNKTPYSVYTLTDSLEFLTDTSLIFYRHRPDSIFIQMMDTTGCILFFDLPIAYPDSLTMLDSIQLTNQDIPAATLGSILPFSPRLDSFHIYTIQNNFVNNTGKDLLAGLYYLHVFFDSCTFIWGPYTIGLITQTNVLSENIIDVFPNPVYDQLNIRNKSEQYVFSYELIYIQGLSSINGTLSPGMNFIDISALNAGVYCLKLSNEEMRSLFWVVKH